MDVEKVISYFKKVCSIPRASGDETAIADYIVAFAKERNLDVYRDEVNNIIIRKPGTVKGAEPVILQGHLDMVYVKDFCQMLYKAVFVDRECGYYNVGTGVGTSLVDQIKGMVEVFGKEGKKSNIVMRPDKPNAPQYIMDITPAVEELGYQPKYNYVDMLHDFKLEMERAGKEK